MKARLSDQPISPQKTRLVADLIRGQHVGKALDTLSFTNKKAAKMIRKLLESAIANAENNDGEEIEELFVKEITVDQATTLKRFKARAKGRGNRILKRRCHVNIVLSTADAA